MMIEKKELTKEEIERKNKIQDFAKRASLVQKELTSLAKDINEFIGDPVEEHFNPYRIYNADIREMVAKIYKESDISIKKKFVKEMTDEEYFNYVKEVLLEDFRFGWMKLINSKTAVVEDHWAGRMGESFSSELYRGSVDSAIEYYIKNNPVRRLK